MNISSAKAHKTEYEYGLLAESKVVYNNKLTTLIKQKRPPSNIGIRMQQNVIAGLCHSVVSAVILNHVIGRNNNGKVVVLSTGLNKTSVH